MYNDHKESEATAREERDHERDSVAPKEYTGESAKELQKNLQALQQTWKEKAPKREAKAARQRMHIQKRYDYDGTKHQLASFDEGKTEKEKAEIDQQRASISKVKAAIDEADPELRAAKTEAKTLQVLVPTWPGINMKNKHIQMYMYVHVYPSILLQNNLLLIADSDPYRCTHL